MQDSDKKRETAKDRVRPKGRPRETVRQKYEMETEGKKNNERPRKEYKDKPDREN